MIADKVYTLWYRHVRKPRNKVRDLIKSEEQGRFRGPIVGSLPYHLAERVRKVNSVGAQIDIENKFSFEITGWAFRNNAALDYYLQAYKGYSEVYVLDFGRIQEGHIHSGTYYFHLRKFGFSGILEPEMNYPGRSMQMLNAWGFEFEKFPKDNQDESPVSLDGKVLERIHGLGHVPCQAKIDYRSYDETPS